MNPGALLLVLAGASLSAQSLRVQPSTAARGSAGSFLITLNAPDGKQIIALQWNMRLPDGVTVSMPDIVAGSAAESVQKSVACVVLADRKGGGTPPAYACLLAGGQKPLPNGPIAAVRYHILKTAHVGAATVRVENALGVSADAKKVEIAAAEGVITVK